MGLILPDIPGVWESALETGMVVPEVEVEGVPTGVVLEVEALEKVVGPAIPVELVKVEMVAMEGNPPTANGLQEKMAKALGVVVQAMQIRVLQF